MEWFSQNWVWVLFFAGMVAMHMFRHGGHGDGRGDGRTAPKPKSKDSVQRASEQGPDHQH